MEGAFDFSVGSCKQSLWNGRTDAGQRGRHMFSLDCADAFVQPDMSDSVSAL